MSERIQLSRKKGSRLPPNTVTVARPGKWGNPWRIGQKLLHLSGEKAGEEVVLDRNSALELYRRSVFAKTLAGKQFRALVRKELKGKNLACWCKLSEDCHADVLLQIAASKEEEQ